MDRNLDNDHQEEFTGERALSALNAPPFQTRDHPGTLPATDDVMRGFNRNTRWLATGVLGLVVFAAFVLAVLLQGSHQKAANRTEEARPTGSDLFFNANPDTLSKVVGLKGETTGGLTSRQAIGVDHEYTVISPPENSNTETAASTRTSVDALAPQINQADRHASTNWFSPALPQDSSQVIRPRVPKARTRSSVRPRFVDVKTRLLALWHQSLKRPQESSGWTLFSRSNQWRRKKISYTEKTNR